MNAPAPYSIATIAMIVFFAIYGLIAVLIVNPSHTLVIIEGIAALVAAIALLLRK
jgi:hypothetical protein